jgi:hypothetical protein
MKTLSTATRVALFLIVPAASVTANLLPVDSIPSPASGTSLTRFDIPKDPKRVYDLSFTLSNTGENPVAVFEIDWLNLPVFLIGGSSGSASAFGPTEFQFTLFSPPELDTGPTKPLDFTLSPQFTLTNLSLEAIPEPFSTAWLLLPVSGFLLYSTISSRSGQFRHPHPSSRPKIE